MKYSADTVHRDLVGRERATHKRGFSERHATVLEHILLHGSGGEEFTFGVTHRSKVGRRTVGCTGGSV